MSDPQLQTANGEVPLADFDLDEWIDGSTGITGAARLVKRGDLLARRDQLEAELKVAKKVAADLTVADRGPEAIERDLEDIYEQIYRSMLWVHIQDRTEARRDKLREKLQAEGLSEDDIGLHIIADSIVKVETADGRLVPLGKAGVAAAQLTKYRDKCGDSAIMDVIRVWREVTSKAPAVRAPLSPTSSPSTGGTTSPSRSAPHKRGGSHQG